MKYISVDIEADGPIPGDYSMIALGAVVVDRDLETTFYAEIRPISENYVVDALAVSGFTREQTLTFALPYATMNEFADWLDEQAAHDKIKFISDNAGFDWMFVCWYLHHFAKRNPFGYSSESLTSMFHGYKQDMRARFRHMRRTKHSHNALDDAKGNAEVIQQLRGRIKNL
jgi:DNA polymerase III epsilon subunit-like protein